MHKESRKIVPFDGYYMALKPNGNGSYYKRGRVLCDLRALLNYVQNAKAEYKLELSQVDGGLRKKLEEIVSGRKTVTDKDWRELCPNSL